MERLDRLGWAAGLSFASYGVRVGVRVNDHAALELLSARLPPGWTPAPSPSVERLYSFVLGGAPTRRGVRGFNLLYANAGRVARTADVARTLDAFESDLHLYVAEMSRRRVFVHAGAVGWRGGAILLPGRSFAGKSTLVAELIRAGADYYSDEYAVLDARGRVHPFARPLSIRGSAPQVRRRETAESLGGRTGVKPLPVRAVVLSRFKEGARWRPKRLTQGHGLLALLDHTVPARRDPGRALNALRQVVARAVVVQSLRGEAKETAPSVLECCSF